MKFSSLAPFILTLSLAPLGAQTPAAPAAPVEQKKEESKQPELNENQKAFLNLPEEKRKEFATHLGEASRLFQAKRIFECLDEIYKAELIFKNAPEIYNIRGSCYVEFRAFDKAMEDFRKATELSPGNPSVEFNIAEVLFVTRQWKEANEAFEALAKKLPPNDMNLGRLVEFKLLLCKEKLGMKNDVILLANKHDYLDDSPYYYFAQATLAYEANDLLKAEEWLARGGRIFMDPNVLAPWQDTLVEFGYIKSFYGEDSGGATPDILTN